MRDAQGRDIEYLRLAITDVCNLRCLYCMPEGGVKPLRHEELLRFEELLRVVRVMAGLGVCTVRLTGGEPMARRGCLTLARMLKDEAGIERLAMTTNGLLLKGRMAEAKAAGLDALNISIDTLNPTAYANITRGGDVATALAAIREAVEVGFSVKLNAVPVRGLNEDGLCDLAALARELPLDVRFIELMPVGCGAALEPVPMDAVRAMLEKRFGPLQNDDAVHGTGPAIYMKPQGFTGSVGFIAAVSHAFCDRCNRVRLTPEGRLKLCLNHSAGMDLRALLRQGISDDGLRDVIRAAMLQKPTRHGFSEPIPDRELRRMNQIGG